MRVSSITSIAIAFAASGAGTAAAANAPAKIPACKTGYFYFPDKNMCLLEGGERNASNDDSEDCQNNWYFLRGVGCVPRWHNSQKEPYNGSLLNPLNWPQAISCSLFKKGCNTGPAGLPPVPACPANTKLDVNLTKCVIIQNNGTSPVVKPVPPHNSTRVPIPTTNTTTNTSTPATPACPPGEVWNVRENRCVSLGPAPAQASKLARRAARNKRATRSRIEGY